MIHTISAGNLGRSIANAYDLAKKHNVVLVRHSNGQEMYLLPAGDTAHLALAMRLKEDKEFAKEISQMVWAFQQAGVL